MAVLLDFARTDGWPKEDIHFLKTFLTTFNVGGDSKS